LQLGGAVTSSHNPEIESGIWNLAEHRVLFFVVRSSIKKNKKIIKATEEENE